MSVPPPGAWRSPVSAELVSRLGVTRDAVQMAGDAVFWIESQPTERRNVLVRWSPKSGCERVLPSGSEVGSRAHEYGGGAYLATPTQVWFSREDDQRVYRADSSGSLHAVTPEPSIPCGHRYADARLAPDGRWLVCVRESVTGRRTVNELVAIPVDGGHPKILHSGHDFYSFPRIRPDGRYLAWTSWNQPLMPWDGTWLWIAEIHQSGQLGEAHLVAGGEDESIFQPEWSHQGVLHFISDRFGWWNLYRWKGERVEQVVALDAELGVAQWEFGYATYAFLSGGRIALVIHEGPRQRLVIVKSGFMEEVSLPYTSIKPYLATDGERLALIGSSPIQMPTVTLVDPARGGVAEISGGDRPIDRRYISVPEPFAFGASDGQTAHGRFYSPRNPQAGVPAGTRPPVIVRAHPGPTANFPLRLEPVVQFFTSRGFAVVDIDFRGSTGYGRRYRQALRGQWGELDARDCCDAILHLEAQGRVDRKQAVISGASAGGYTALRSLQSCDAFAAATVRSAIVDPGSWRKTAPKFQAHYAEGLIGPWPQAAGLYRDRSPLHRPAGLDKPLLLIHGADDRITPAGDAEQLARALRQLGVPCTLLTFPEGHSMDNPQTVRSALEAELAHYRAALSLGQS